MDRVGITKFYSNEISSYEGCTIKDKCEEFVVQEVNSDGYICQFDTLLNLEKYQYAKEKISDIPKNLDKNQRKEVYNTFHYYPLKNVKTVDGEIVLTDSLVDIFNFTVMKCDLNTSDMVGILSKRLGIPYKSIHISGNKDKKAVTFQEVSAVVSFDILFNYARSLNSRAFLNYEKYGHRKDHDNINNQIVDLMSNHISILPLEEYSENIKIFNIRKGPNKKLGSHNGNIFTIKITGLPELKTIPKKFINYFGQQRFGKHFNNHLIGKFILEKSYQEAVDMILGNGFLNEKGEPCKENDIASSDSKVQKYIRKQLEKKCKPKYIIEGLNREFIMLYLHSYQSYLFNVEISKKIEFRKFDSTDKIKVGDEFMDITEETKIDDIYAQLKKLPSKFLKGSNRKIIEDFEDFDSWTEDGSIIVKFKLNNSAYATMALREIIGNAVNRFE